MQFSFWACLTNAQLVTLSARGTSGEGKDAVSTRLYCWKFRSNAKMGGFRKMRTQIDKTRTHVFDIYLLLVHYGFKLHITFIGSATVQSVSLLPILVLWNRFADIHTLTQARNQLGTPWGRRVFWEWFKFFKQYVKYFQTTSNIFFQWGTKNFQAGLLPSCPPGYGPALTPLVINNPMLDLLLLTTASCLWFQENRLHQQVLFCRHLH